MFIPFHTCHQEAFLALSPPGKQIKTTWTWCKKHWMLGPWCCRSWSCHLRQHSCPVATFPTKPSEIANEIQKNTTLEVLCHSMNDHLGSVIILPSTVILHLPRGKKYCRPIEVSRSFSPFLASASSWPTSFFSRCLEKLTFHLVTIQGWHSGGRVTGSCAASASYLNFPEISKTRPPAVHWHNDLRRHRMITGWLAWWHSKNSGTNQLPQSLRWLPMGKPSPIGQKAGMSAWCQYGMPNAKASASVELFLIQNLSFQINNSHIVTYNSWITFDVLNPFSRSLLHIELPV